MLSSLRRGPAVLRSLRCSSLPSTISSVKPSRLSSFSLQVSIRARPSVATFSTIRALRNEASAGVTPTEESSEFTTFEQLGQNGVIHQTVIDTITRRMNIHTMTDVQRMTLNSCLDGSDVIAQAKTGTGKTIAFLLPIIQRICRDPNLAQRTHTRKRQPVDIRALIVSPTRELAEQIASEASRLVGTTSIQVQTAVGGTGKSFHLRKMQNEGCHLLVGTPGRINDLLQDPSSGVSMEKIETFVLDEADRLLDIGFAPAIEEMQSYMPNRADKPRQTLMFSATVPKTVVSLVRQTMRPDFKFVRTVDPDEAPTHARIPQRVVFMKGLENQLPTVLEVAMNAIKAHQEDPVNNLPFKCIVYFGATTQVDMAYEVFSKLRDSSNSRSSPLGNCKVYHMNGRMTQQQRSRETNYFRNADSGILFSTDVTARGMDFPNVSHVIQLGLPRNPDDYIHRLGRTGRAGKSGEGWLLLNEDEKRDFARAFQHKGINMEPRNLESASLDMKQGAQLPANIARMLQMIEASVKSVSYMTKSSVYKSLLGIMQQQFPGRPKQDQIDMMNDLARYGWGMQTPPPLPRSLVEKLGYSRCDGIEFEEPRYGGFNRSDNRGGTRDIGRRASRNDNDPFGMGFGGGKGVFGGGDNGDSSRSFDRSNTRQQGGFGGNRTNRSFDRNDDRRRGGFGGSSGRPRDSFADRF